MKKYTQYQDTGVMTGNSKLGSIPNFSLPPVETCINHTHCSTDCYAVKFFRMYPTVNALWSKNYERTRDNDGELFMENMRLFLSEKQPEFFRIHASGDFFSYRYFCQWVMLCNENPNVKFLAFTKAFRFVKRFLSETGGKLPENLSIVLSVFPGGSIPSSLRHMPVALAGQAAQYQDTWMETRASESLYCPGICDQCGACWSLAKRNIDVRFSIH